MSVGDERVLDLLRELLATSGEARGLAADSVTDWLHVFGDEEVAAVAQILTWLARTEIDHGARESELHALAELAELGRMPSRLIPQIGEIPRAELHGSSLEHYDYLRSLG